MIRMYDHFPFVRIACLRSGVASEDSRWLGNPKLSPRCVSGIYDSNGSRSFELLHRNAGVKLGYQLFRVEVGADRIFGELSGSQPRMLFFHRVEIVDLQLDLVAVRVRTFG
jgi:hypothetical protein